MISADVLKVVRSTFKHNRIAPADFKTKRLDNGYQWFSYQWAADMEICIEPAGKLGYEVALYNSKGEQIGVRCLVEPGAEDLPFSCFQRAMACVNAINEALWDIADVEFLSILGIVKKVPANY